MANWVNGAENVVLSNKSATTGPFTLTGGQYGVTVTATFGGGNVTLQRLAADGSTYVTCLTAFTAAGYASVYLPPGTYQVAITTATGVYADITCINKGIY
jgi:hypothetical protein